MLSSWEENVVPSITAEWPLKRTLFTAVFVGLLLTMNGCAGFRSYEVSKNFNKDQHRRVGLLVTRVGNDAFSVVAPITLQTDYSRRVPKTQSTMGLSEDSVDVYIEDENRLRESIPSYPKFNSAPLANIGSLREQSEEYFRNITPELYTAIAEVFSEKGYEVVDVRKFANTWEKPLSEMTVGQIATHLANKADSLAVFHYTDVANTFLSYIPPGGGRHTESNKGFAAISYTLSMFDTNTKEELVFFRVVWPYYIQKVAASDQNILNDPRYQGRIEVKEDSHNASLWKTSTSVINNNLTDDELLQIALNYICHGVTFVGSEWRGLDTVIP